MRDPEEVGGVGVEVTAVIKIIDKEDYTGSAIKEPIILIGRQIITKHSMCSNKGLYNVL